MHFKPPKIFHDMMEVAKASGLKGKERKAHDVLSQQKQLIPRSPFPISGFQCDQVSGLNTRGGDADSFGAGAVASGQGVTVSTSRALLENIPIV